MGNPPATSEQFDSIESFAANSLLFDTTSGGLMRTNRFQIGISLPNTEIWRAYLSATDLTQDVTKLESMLSFNASSVQCPNIGLDAQRLNLNHAMVTYMGERNDGDLSITFFDSPTLIMRRFFNTWMRAIYDPATKRRNYPADVWSDEFKIHPIMPNGEVSKYGDLFLRVIPVDIGDINYDIADDNSIHRTTVRFVYSVHDVYGKDTRADSYQLGGGSN